MNVFEMIFGSIFEIVNSWIIVRDILFALGLAIVFKAYANLKEEKFNANIFWKIATVLFLAEVVLWGLTLLFEKIITPTVKPASEYAFVELSRRMLVLVVFLKNALVILAKLATTMLLPAAILAFPAVISPKKFREFLHYKETITTKKVELRDHRQSSRYDDNDRPKPLSPQIKWRLFFLIAGISLISMLFAVLCKYEYDKFKFPVVTEVQTPNSN